MVVNMKEGILEVLLVSAKGIKKKSYLGTLSPSLPLVHLGGIISEGNEKGFMELKATPYKVVLDDTYEGEIKIGLKFISNVEMQTKSRDFINEENQPPWSMCKKVFSYLRIPQWRIFHFYKRSIPSMAINKRN
ncbi:hypothetical protein IFM89_013476 [Coptis chinensis]|uniref:Uncharacterized protein n=1 Tax=Coptis chinensis TaxID=261450 RepID=A0A835IAL8_9MAGN|nr:hypothetical protein IFM89_013476 [Coptis chinensis]